MSEARKKLSDAVFSRDLNLVRNLIQDGADPNEPDENGETVLTEWGIFMKPDMLSQLLDSGAKPDEEFLSQQVLMRHTEAIGILAKHEIYFPAEVLMNPIVSSDAIRAYLENGGDPNYADEDGQSGIDFAYTFEKMDIVALLEQYGAKLTPGIETLDEKVKVITEHAAEIEAAANKMAAEGKA